MTATDRRGEIRGFFVSRRARLSPEELGVLTPGQLRRVPGLRREEVAELAGISVEYYTRIERGSLEGVSDAVLHALSAALRLDDSEVVYLHRLAHAAEACAAEQVLLPNTASEGVRRVVDGMALTPAFASNARLDILAINALGRAIFFDGFGVQDESVSQPVNLARLCFEDPRARELYPNWDAVAEITVSLLRLGRNGTQGADDSMDVLIAELYGESEEFRRAWDTIDVTQRFAGSAEIAHRDVGALNLQFEQFHAAAQPGVTMHVLWAEPGSVTHEKLSRLAASL